MGQEAIVETLPSWIGFLGGPCLQPRLNGRLACQQMLCSGISVSLLGYKSPFPQDKRWRGGVGRGRVKGVVAKQGWGEICALMSETEYLASSVSLFLAQWACQRSGGLCWDVISTSAVYQNLLKSTTQACHSAQEFPGNMYCTRAGKHS